ARTTRVEDGCGRREAGWRAGTVSAPSTGQVRGVAVRVDMLPIALSRASAPSSGMVSGPTSSQRSPGTPTSTAGPPGGPSPTVAGAEAWACAEAAAGGPPSAGGADAAPPAASAAPTATTRNSRPASATAPPRLDPESPARAAHGSAPATEIKAV